MTSPPDVWALLERLIAVIDGPKLNDEKYSFKAVEAARAALAQRDRFVLVPKEPTSEMIFQIVFRKGYRAMLAAAPKPEGKP